MCCILRLLAWQSHINEIFFFFQTPKIRENFISRYHIYFSFDKVRQGPSFKTVFRFYILSNMDNNNFLPKRSQYAVVVVWPPQIIFMFWSWNNLHGGAKFFIHLKKSFASILPQCLPALPWNIKGGVRFWSWCREKLSSVTWYF